jgi:hypothetical protein
VIEKILCKEGDAEIQCAVSLEPKRGGIASRLFMIEFKRPILLVSRTRV